MKVEADVDESVVVLKSMREVVETAESFMDSENKKDRRYFTKLRKAAVRVHNYFADQSQLIE